MDQIKLDAAPRDLGKKATKQVRRDGNVPCVLYGHGDEPVHFQVPILSLRPLIFTTETHRVEVVVDGTSWDCILKDVTFHPVNDKPIHADFQILHKGEKIHLTVPVHIVGISAGQKEGGRLVQVLNEVGVYCLPKDIPSQIDVDVTELNVGDAVHISDLGLEGIEFDAEDRQTVVTVVGARPEEEEESDEQAGVIAADEAADAAAEEGDEA